MIDVIDYGGANLFSVLKTLQTLGTKPQVIKTPGEYRGGKILIPGVGAFGDVISQLQRANFVEFIREQRQAGKSILGICSGMQVLFSASEESPGVPGLGFFSEKVLRLPATDKVPHMGWDQLEIKKDAKLLHGLRSGDYVYFAHSYCAPAHGRTFEAANCAYSMAFTAVIEHENLFGVQFHPEKSQKAGMRILQNFIARC
jgi:imidazole glycerol phosphate synthase glutamine amidotransferase subunit